MLTLVSVTSGLTEEKIADPVVKMCLESTCKRGHGTGWPIANNLFVTAGHVTEGKKKIWVKSSQNRVMNGEVLWQASNSDFSLSFVPGAEEFFDYIPNTLACDYKWEKGARVTSEGNPADLEFMTVEGYIAGGPKDEFGSFWKNAYIVSLPAMGGASGSPVWSTEGKVIGIVVGVYRNNQNFTIVEPIKKMCDLLDPIKNVVDEKRTNVNSFDYSGGPF